MLRITLYHTLVFSALKSCFLDFTLFEEYPEFFSTYMFMNTKNHMIYSDKLKLHVIDLTCIHLAAAEDKACGIDYWANLFKASFGYISVPFSKKGIIS